MIKKKHISFYKNNREYAKFLSGVDIDLYNKYIKLLSPCSPSDRVLDVGCGVGTVVNKIASKNNKNVYGIDVSSNLIKKAERGGGKYRVYSGKRIPYKDGYFKKIGCFTVIEHVENPEEVIEEMVRVTEPGGEVIIAAPNFLRVVGFSATHWRTKGLKNPIVNFYLTLKKYINSLLSPEKMRFGFMEPKINKNRFNADDDAVCVTNPVDVKFFLRKSGVKIIYQSGLVNFHKSALVNFISHLPLLREITGGFLLLGVKNGNS